VRRAIFLVALVLGAVFGLVLGGCREVVSGAAVSIPMVLTLPAEVYVDHPFIFLIRDRGGALFGPGHEPSRLREKRRHLSEKFIVVGPVSPRSFRCRKPAPRASGATALLPKV